MDDKRFPIYLQIKNGKSFYKIENDKTLFEYQIIGEKYLFYKIEASILPERNLIHDMITNLEQRWEPITEVEFEVLLKHCKENLTQIN